MVTQYVAGFLLWLIVLIRNLNAEITIDAFGVETSSEPFVKRPNLYLNVTYDLYEKDPTIPPIDVAETMLADDMIHNLKLKTTWDAARLIKPGYNSVQLAALAYTMGEPDFLYIDFNSDTSAFRDDSDYATYYYKGFFGLLQMPSQSYNLELYRGVTYTQEAQVGQYLRFNRFLSYSSLYDVATQFVGYMNPGTGGTIFVVRGTTPANYISPYSLLPYEEEHLITQDAQFIVDSIDTVLLSNDRKITRINMTSVPYLD